MAEDEKPEYEVGLTGPDWEPKTDSVRWYAQNKDTFAFGPTAVEALMNLIRKEATTTTQP